MEFKITRENFLQGLTRTQGVVEKRNTMPVLSNILIEADKNGLKLAATDLEVALSLNLTAQTIEPGRITVSARSLTDIVREINNPEIKVKLKENDKIEVSAGSSLFTIPGLSASEFPSLPKVDAKSVELPCDVIAGMLGKTAFSMSTEETRQNLAGILFQKEGSGSLRMVSTDGHRLSLVDGEADVEALPPIKVIIPRKGVHELKKMVSEGGTFELAVAAKNLFARKGNETLFIRLIDGEFPDYTRVVPKDNDKIAVLDRAKVIGALRRVSLLSNEKSRGVLMSFSQGHVEVSIKNPDAGEAREEFDIDYNGSKLNIGFNARYFLDVMDVIDDDKISIALQSDLTACLIKAPKDKGFLCVVMPMRI